MLARPFDTPVTMPASVTEATVVASLRHPVVTDWVWPLVRVAVAVAVDPTSTTSRNNTLIAGVTPGLVGVPAPELPPLHPTAKNAASIKPITALRITVSSLFKTSAALKCAEWARFGSVVHQEAPERWKST